MSSLRSTALGITALIGAMASLAVGTSFAKRLFPLVGAEGTTLLRVSFAAVFLLALFRPWKRPLATSHRATLLGYGASLGAMNLLFYLSLRTVPFGVAVAFEFLGPLAVAIFASRRPADFAWIVLSVLGLSQLLVFRSTTALDPVGVGYALAAGGCWALYIVFGHRLSSLHAGQVTSVGMSVAALVVAPFGVLRVGPALEAPAALFAGLFAATFSSAIPYSLEMLAFKRLPKKTFSVLLSLEPAFAALGGWVLLDERLSERQWLAIGCVIVASMGSARSAAREAVA